MTTATVKPFTQDELSCFKAFEVAGDRDAVAREQGRPETAVLLFRKHYPKFRPQRYCEWKRREQK